MAGSAPSTATVLEFRCLFTHDLRRKQKRWQDGRLKYHTFNARIMVYDERGNSVGDMHWHGEYDFGEGEEVQLDRGGVIVQVEDLVERKETDLSELVDKRVQEKQQRQMQQLARSGASGAVPPRSLPRPPIVAPDRAQPPRHRPLHHVIGTPTGHHGKALVPKESPFEQRQQAAESPDERTAKGRRYDEPPPSKSGYASALFGQTLTLSATPSSFVPAIRRPRPEARSDSPPEDAQDPRRGPESTRREQPQSSRRLIQSGYAQSLFGQALTLSHTPVVSVPSRSQPRNASVSNTTVDLEAQETSETAGLATSQQLNESPDLGQLGSNSRSALLSTQSRVSNRLTRGSTDIDKSKGNASLSRQHNATNNVHTIPESVDIIEIDDPEPTAHPSTRQPGTQRITSASSRNPEKTSNIAKIAAREGHRSPEDPVHSTRQKMSEPGRHDKPKKARTYDRTSEPETADSRTNGTDASSGRTDAATLGNVSRAPDVTRDPALPVTELRIKSRKKRGLMMISDTSKSKKARRKVPTDSASPRDGDSAHRSRDSDDDVTFHQSSPSRPTSKFGSHHSIGEPAKDRSMASRHTPRNDDEDDDDLDYPVLNRDGEWEKDGVMVEREKQRTISTELGEDDDPFQSQPLAISDRTHYTPEPAARHVGKRLGQESPGQAEVLAPATAQNPSDASLCFLEIGTGEPADIVQPTTRSPSPTKARYDPYRIPSSPRASSTGIPSSAQRKGHEQDAGVEILRPTDNNKKPSRAKTQRQTRRKVIADEDDEDDVDPAGPLTRSTGSGLDFVPGPASVPCEEAANTQPKPRKSTKTRAQQDNPTVESSDERPRRGTRKPKSQQKEPGMESEEDELPVVRRQSRRQKRSRSTSTEEPSPLPSEQDDSEEENFPRKRRKTKASKASDDRPRLEKIKKNVKSRELVGFNLAALNAPLGLRGIGMPFSILPSPVNESIQRRGPKSAVADEKKSLVVVDQCGEQMLPSGQDPSAAPPKRNAEAQQKSLSETSGRERMDHVPLESSDLHVYDIKPQGENVPSTLVEPGGLANPKVPETGDSSKSSGPEGASQIPTRNENKQTQGQASPWKQARAPHEPVPSKPSPEPQQYHAAASTTQGITTGAPTENTLSSLDQPARNPLPSLSRQSSTVAKHTTSDKATLDAPTKPVANVQGQSAPANTSTTEAAINAGFLLRDESNANGQQPSNTAQAAKGEKEISLKESVAADRPANVAAKSQAATSLNQKPSVRKQPSILESAQASNTAGSDPNVQADTSTDPSAMDNPGPASSRRSEVTDDQETVAIRTVVGNADADRASALPARPPNAIGLRRQASAPRSINNIGAKSTPQAEKTGDLSTDVHSRAASNARLANPASRGRKAALASHAAGPVPQRILPPTQPGLMHVVTISTADLEMTPVEQAPKEPERPKKKMTFPGFQSARSDGPWSREAFDLLESGRPE